MYLVLCLMMMVVEDCVSSLDCVKVETRMLDTQDVKCSCQDYYGDQEIFTWSDLDEIQTQDVQFQNLILTKCSQLHLELEPPHPSPLPHLLIKNMDKVVVYLSQDMPHPNLTITNVSKVQYRPMLQENTPDMLMYVALTVSVVVVLVLTVFLVVLLWSRLTNKDNSDTKKVSRAESWRYESSLYVNPSNRPQPVFVPPPPFPDFIQSATSSRSRAPNSVSSSPLMRPKYNSLREVDLVRTSLPTQQGRQRQNTYHGTPPAYREPVDSIVCNQKADRYEDSDDQDQNEEQTLPHRYR